MTIEKFILILGIIATIIIIIIVSIDTYNKTEICGEPSILHQKGPDGCMICSISIKPYWDEEKGRYIRNKIKRVCNEGFKDE